MSNCKILVTKTVTKTAIRMAIRPVIKTVTKLVTKAMAKTVSQWTARVTAKMVLRTAQDALQAIKMARVIPTPQSQIKTLKSPMARRVKWSPHARFPLENKG